MEPKKLVAWGLIISLAVALLTAFGLFYEEAYTVAGIGLWVFGIWAAVILFKNTPKIEK